MLKSLQRMPEIVVNPAMSAANKTYAIRLIKTPTRYADNH